MMNEMYLSASRLPKKTDKNHPDQVLVELLEQKYISILSDFH